MWRCSSSMTQEVLVGGREGKGAVRTQLRRLMLRKPKTLRKQHFNYELTFQPKICPSNKNQWSVFLCQQRAYWGGDGEAGQRWNIKWLLHCCTSKCFYENPENRIMCSWATFSSTFIFSWDRTTLTKRILLLTACSHAKLAASNPIRRDWVTARSPFYSGANEILI